METQDLQAVAEVSILVGKGPVSIPLSNVLCMDAYHAPRFQTNIISVGLLTRHFNGMFSIDPPAR